MSPKRHRKTYVTSPSCNRKQPKRTCNHSTDIKKIVDGPILKFHILCKQNVSMEIIKFASFSNGTLRVLLGGKCPSCRSMHIRNTCNALFCRNVLSDIVLCQFKDIVKVVVPVLTHDGDFVEVCKKVGYKIIYPFPNDEEGETLKQDQVEAAVAFSYHHQISSQY